jgi:protein-L-isoaspartate(D-aspartate) O-methyltransferase
MPADHLSSWHQLNIDFGECGTATETAARRLLPALTAAQRAGELKGWWFMRKRPWKLRYLTSDTTPAARIAALLNQLASTGGIGSWASGIYEPETAAFGGPRGMDTAHVLFHRDSVHILTRAAGAKSGHTVAGHRETVIVLGSVMLRAAGLDWYEQGDVWNQVRTLRAGPVSTGRAACLRPAVLRLMTADARPLCASGGRSPLAGRGGWVTAFEDAGLSLAALANQGRLTRGLRAVLAHNIIFHANRAGISLIDQAVIAAAATAAVFDETARPVPSRVNEVTG